MAVFQEKRQMGGHCTYSGIVRNGISIQDSVMIVGISKGRSVNNETVDFGVGKVNVFGLNAEQFLESYHWRSC